ncbi:MAG: DUF4166 domain-containing protein [Pseudomonadota bacterium]
MTGEASLFEAALGPRWAALPPEVRAAHSFRGEARLVGSAEVTRGRGPLARLIAWAFRFPPAAPEVPVVVKMTRDAGGEIWARDFGGHVLRSRLRPGTAPGRVRERFLFIDFDLALTVEDRRLRLSVAGASAFGAPLPRFLLPRSDAAEFEDEGLFRFNIGVFAPFGGGLVVRYRGWLKPADPP